MAGIKAFYTERILISGSRDSCGRSFRVLKNFVQRLIFDMTDINLESDLMYENLLILLINL